MQTTSVSSNASSSVMLDREHVQALTRALAEPFELKDVKFKPQMVKQNRALALAYVDARVIQDRLDAVLGVEGWQDEYQLLPDNSVMCRLRLRLGKRWITKMDVGSPSEQPDGGDRLKAAFSDALKRAAVKFGIGRYLYRLPSAWVSYDPVKKQLTETPQLPAFALPASAKAKEASAKPAKKPQSEQAAGPIATTASSSGSSAPRGSQLPKTGTELHHRLRAYDAQLHQQGVCPLGTLLAHVTQAGIRAGYATDMSQWEGDAIQFAVEQTRKFLDQQGPTQADPKSAA